MKNKKILLLGLGDKRWLGGLYYVRNILFMLINSKLDNIELYLLTTTENYDIFKKFEKDVKIIKVEPTKVNKIKKIFYFFVLKRSVNKQVNSIVDKYQIDFIYPINSFPFLGIEEKCVHWIPDFQHKCLPQYFPLVDRVLRNFLFKSIIKSKQKLVLSSKKAKTDLYDFYNTSRNDVAILHFVSDIEDYIEQIQELNFSDVKKKYELSNKYCYIPNQFWSYKNHIVAFEGIKKYNEKNPESKLNIVCTGSTTDRRNPGYFNALMDQLKSMDMIDDVKILGMIPRIDQLQILKNACILLQPSLFEGWGTGVEEAKRLGLKIIMSDIPVHIEQMENEHLVFRRNSSDDLYEKINDIIDVEKINDPELLKSKFYSNCRKYIQPFLEEIVGIRL